MKNYSLAIAFFVLITGSLLSCGGKKETGISVNPEKRGKYLYEGNCLSCHQAEGVGVKDMYPPLQGSDYLLANKANGVNAVKYGLKGEITVLGHTYDSFMPPVSLSDEDIMHVLNYVRNSWGNTADSIRIEDIK